MWGSIIVLVLAVLVAGKPNGPLCATQEVDWIVSIPESDHVSSSVPYGVAQFFTTLLEKGEVRSHYVTAVSYTDANSGCMSYFFPRTLVRSPKPVLPDSYLRKHRNVQEWNMAGFDSLVRPLLMTSSSYALSKTSKKIFIYFYDSPSLMSTSSTLDKKDSGITNANEECKWNNYVNWDMMQEKLQQWDATVVAIKIPSHNTEGNDSHNKEELEQLEKLRHLGLKLRAVSLTREPTTPEIVNAIWDALREECYPPIKTLSERLRLFQAVGNCKKPLDWLIVYPSSPYGLGWAQNFAASITQLADDLGTIDQWNIAVVKFTDMPNQQYGDNPWARCATQVLTATPIRSFEMRSLRQDSVYDRGDREHAGLDAVARSLVYRGTGLRDDVQKIVIYVHNAASHLQTTVKPLTGYEWWFIQNVDINAYCDNTFDFTSINRLKEIVGSSIIVDVNVPSDSTRDFGKPAATDQHYTLGHYKIKTSLIDLFYYPGESSSYKDLIKGITPFCRV